MDRFCRDPRGLYPDAIIPECVMKIFRDVNGERSCGVSGLPHQFLMRDDIRND